MKISGVTEIGGDREDRIVDEVSLRLGDGCHELGSQADDHGIDRTCILERGLMEHVPVVKNGGQDVERSELLIVPLGKIAIRCGRGHSCKHMEV